LEIGSELGKLLLLINHSQSELANSTSYRLIGFFSSPRKMTQC
jgi:hypothetical protein